MIRRHSWLPTLATLVLTLALVTCSDDDDPVQPVDMTPPRVTAVTPMDERHIDITFNETLDRTSAENIAHYVVIQTSAFASALNDGAAEPGDTLNLVAAVLKLDNRTVSITGGSMIGADWNLSVAGVADARGNTISTPTSNAFTGSDRQDETPPSVLRRSPGHNETGLSLTPTMTVQFSEAVLWGRIELLQDRLDLQVEIQQVDATTFTFTPTMPLYYNTVYSILAWAEDLANNFFQSEPWQFTTLVSTDHTPPTVEFSPADLSTNVDVYAPLTIRFSEPIRRFKLSMGFDPDLGAATFADPDDRTIVITPTEPLQPNTQYLFSVHRAEDLAGHPMKGIFTSIFTTGPALENGSIAGTLSGGIGDETGDPTGAMMVVGSYSIWSPVQVFDVMGSLWVADDNTYAFPHLPDGTYVIAAMIDANNDGRFTPRDGEPVGIYGMDIATGDTDPDSLTIVAGSDFPGTDFAIFDPSAITGSVQYNGVHAGGDFLFHVGLFDPAGFDPENPGEPVAVSEEVNGLPDDVTWNVNSFVQVIPDGDYIVGVYLDVTNYGSYDPAFDPAGYYRSGASLATVHLENGNELSGIAITLVDPSPKDDGAATRWRARWPNDRLKRIGEIKLTHMR